MSHAFWFALSLIGTALGIFLAVLLLGCWLNAKSQQRLDRMRYGHAESVWQIFLEILKIREVK